MMVMMMMMMMMMVISGRGSVSKLESWARQQEVWREQTEERLNGLWLR